MKITTADGLTIEFTSGEEEAVARMLAVLNKPPKKAAQQVPKPKPKPKTRGAKQAETAAIYRKRVGNQAKEIRAWAKDNGFAIGTVGFIPNEVLDAFERRGA